jgi:hypothetical protein
VGCVDSWIQDKRNGLKWGEVIVEYNKLRLNSEV